jgi:5'-nucleotidase (lipoprotein e(P4) family)
MKNLFFPLFFFSLFFSLTSCIERRPEKENVEGKHLEMAVLYQQRAAEYKALCYQAFNIAEVMLETDLQNTEITKKRALVFDIDETVLDNSPYQAKCVLEGISYPEKWKDWCNMSKAKAVPGAVAFINKAYQKGLAIFYISNRKIELFDATKENLLSEGLPLANDSFLLMRTAGNSKKERREQVLKDYHIALFFGDNLGDFDDNFDDKTESERDSISLEFKKEFGKRFIVLPNAMYGDWEMVLYDKDDATKEKQEQNRKDKLIGF